MAIHKIVVKATVLVEADTLAQASNVILVMSLQELGEAMDQGEHIGTYSIDSADTIEPENVKQELLEIGNDGTFFGDASEEQE